MSLSSFIIILSSLIIGSSGIAMIVVLQSWLFIDPGFLQLLKYSTISAPLMIIANAFLFLGFNKGDELVENLASIVAFQTGIYLTILAVLSYFIHHDNISINVLIGLIIVSIGAYIINM